MSIPVGEVCYIFTLKKGFCHKDKCLRKEEQKNGSEPDGSLPGSLSKNPCYH